MTESTTTRSRNRRVQTCAFCGREAPGGPAPAESDLVAWHEERRHHARTCPWVLTHGGQQESGEVSTITQRRVRRRATNDAAHIGRIRLASCSDFWQKGPGGLGGWDCSVCLGKIETDETCWRATVYAAGIKLVLNIHLECGDAAGTTLAGVIR